MPNYTYIYRKVEHITCECTSTVIGSDIAPDEMYMGRTKTAFGISVARQMAFMVMHDHYGINYRSIAEHSQMTIGTVMKCVRKARMYRFTDSVYSLVYNMIEDKL